MSDRLQPLRIVSLIIVMALSSQAFAQLGGARIDRPIDTPTFSPYLNMLRSGGPALNYFGLVRPQMDFAQQNQQLGQNLQTLQMQQTQGMRSTPGPYAYSQLGMTGHPVYFNTFGNGQFSGGYTGAMGGGGGFVGGGSGINGGFNQFGGQAGVGGLGAYGVSPGFSGVSGHPAQFGGIGNSSQGMIRSR